MLISLLVYSFTIVNVGLEISSCKFQKDKKPSVNLVFPAPKSPREYYDISPR